MCDLETFKLDVKALKQGKTLLGYVLDDSFFEAIDAPEIRKGKVNVELQATRNGDLFELNFNIEGSVSIPCDLCLDDMEQAVSKRTADSEVWRRIFRRRRTGYAGRRPWGNRPVVVRLRVYRT